MMVFSVTYYLQLGNVILAIGFIFTHKGQKCCLSIIEHEQLYFVVICILSTTLEHNLTLNSE